MTEKPYMNAHERIDKLEEAVLQEAQRMAKENQALKDRVFKLENAGYSA